MEIAAGHMLPNKELTIRKSSYDDLPRLQEIFAKARRFMAENGNPTQWDDNYPSQDMIEEDLSFQDSYVCVYDGRIVATFVLREGDDPTYAVIYDGAWIDDTPYATIHRIASSGEVRGIFRRVIEFALARYQSVRIDTHRNNIVMQTAINHAGFKYCGIIHCFNGDERLAYQINK